MQYAHDFSVSTFAKEHKLCSHQINGSKETIRKRRNTRQRLYWNVKRF